MKSHSFTPGSPEWLAHRSTCWNASDAAAMLGCSPHETRTALLQRLHTGIDKDISDFQQRKVIDPGHEFEARARVLAEEIIGEDLAPTGGSKDFGLSKPLGASFDGATMLVDVLWEHKRLNDELRAILRGDTVADATHLPKHFRVQMEQQLMVSSASRVLFMASDWDGDRLVEERHCWYTSDPKLRAEILAGWKQFEADLAAYEPRAAEPPKPVGHAPESLPALRIEITGAVTASNLAEFKDTALGAIRSVNRELSTDQHFADAETAVKWCSDVESRIKAAKDHALSQTASIEAMFRTMDEVSAEARRVRLDLEKLVERRKTEIKGELVAAAKTAYERHEQALRQDTGGPWIVLQPPDFGGAIKGKRSVDAMRDALDTTLANAKIKADESARGIRAALAALDEEAKEHAHLFADRLSFIGKAPGDVRLLAKARITEHQVKLQREAEAAAEAARERIRAEEAARLQREQQERDALERREREAADALARRPQLLEQARQIVADIETAEVLRDAVAAASPTVVQMQPRAPAGPPTLKLGDIQKHMTPMSVTAEGLRTLGFEAAGKQGAAVLYRDDELPYILTAAIQHLTKARDQLQRAA